MEAGRYPRDILKKITKNTTKRTTKKTSIGTRKKARPRKKTNVFALPAVQVMEIFKPTTRCFSNQISKVFASLKVLEDGENEARNQPTAVTLLFRFPKQDLVSSIDRDYHRFSSWRFHLLNPQELPQLAAG